MLNLAKNCKKWFIFSDSAKKGGVGDILSAFLQDEKIFDVSIVSFEFDDKFIQHGKISDVEQGIGVDTKSICLKILSELNT